MSAISLSNGKVFSLNLPDELGIKVAVQGLKRVRFMAKSPDGRIFVTDMYNKTDNSKGVVYILDKFDQESGTFKEVTPYLEGLRNPNSIAFYKDESGYDWFYLALTDRLLRYKYTAGETKPATKPEVLATFPDYGLSYKYGGWHLTRTIAIGGNGKLYISVGSSCNACEEKEEVRASILEMDRIQDGSKPGDRPEDIINGFFLAGKINGRPVDVMSFGVDGFLLTDDYAGVIYYVYEK